MIARLSAVNEVIELRTAALILSHRASHLDRMLGGLLGAIADEWAETSRRPSWAAEVLELADAAIGGA